MTQNHWYIFTTKTVIFMQTSHFIFKKAFVTSQLLFGFIGNERTDDKTAIQHLYSSKMTNNLAEERMFTHTHTHKLCFSHSLIHTPSAANAASCLKWVWLTTEVSVSVSPLAPPPYVVQLLGPPQHFYSIKQSPHPKNCPYNIL